MANFVLCLLFFIPTILSKSYKADVLLHDSRAKSDACPLGLESSVPGDPHCYLFYQFPLQFYQAHEHCRQMGSHLVYVPNGDVNQFISETSHTKFDPNGESTYWLGGQNLANSNKWIWLDGSDFSKFTNWDTNQPGNSTEERCLSGKIENGKWISEKCYGIKPFVCAYSKQPIPTKQPYPSPTPSVKSCPNGWFYMPGSKSCFLVKKAVDYPNDELYCEKFGGHLASIHSFPENSFITDLAASYATGKTALIGFYRKVVNDVTSWGWNDLTPVDYLFWDGVVPIGNATQNCVVINLGKNSRFGHWDPVNCDDKTIDFSVCKLILQ